MFVVVVTAYVKEERVKDFVEAVLDNARNTRDEPGNLRFDVLREEGESTRFMLYEAYRTKEDFAAHQQTAHYLRWKTAVADWMAEPRTSVKAQSVFFGNGE